MNLLSWNCELKTSCVFWYLFRMRAKLGLLNGRYENDEELIKNLFDTMRMTAADFTTTFKIIEKVSRLTMMDDPKPYDYLGPLGPKPYWLE